MKRLSLASDSFDSQEIDAAVAVMKSGKYTMGEQVKSFEAELAQWLGVKHCLMVNSGSSANLLMVEGILRSTLRKGLLQPGDEVLVPALSWPTTVWPLVQLGLVPVFVDVDPTTLAIDVVAAEKELSPKTKAVFLIHVLGLSADMTGMNSFCQRHNLLLLEDCCESFGAFFDRKHVGRFGKMGSLSHFFSHHLTTMEGGTILTDDTELYDDLKSFRAHGWIRDRFDKGEWIDKHPDLDPRFLFVTTGYNVRPMEIQAAIGKVQLKKMDFFLRKRDELASAVNEILNRQLKGAIELIGAKFINNSEDRFERRHSWMNLPFRIRDEFPLNRKQVMAIFEETGIETRPIIAGNLARHPACHNLPVRVAESLTVCDRILDRGFMVGCHHDWDEEHLATFEAAVKKVVL